MSRIGRMPITIPAGVEVKLNGQHITVKGAQSTLEMDIHPDISVSIDGNIIKVERPSDEKEHRSLHGLTRSLINNMVVGVSQGFTKELDINGLVTRQLSRETRLYSILVILIQSKLLSQRASLLMYLHLTRSSSRVRTSS